MTQGRMTIVVWCFAGILLGVAGTAEATSITLSPSTASYVGLSFDGTVSYGPFTGQPFGTLVGLIDHAQSGNPTWSAESRSLFEFDLGTIAPSSISSATLRFTAVDPTAFGAGSCFDLTGCPNLSVLNLYGFSGDGLASISDFGLGTFLTSIDPRPAGTALALDVTTFLTTVTTGYGGFNVRAGSVNGAMGLMNVTLDIDYGTTPVPVPEPTTFLLLGTGLAVAARRRMRRS